MHILINGIPLLSCLTGIGNYVYNISKCLINIDTCNQYTFFYGYFSSELQPFPHSRNIFSNLKFRTFKKAKFFTKKIPVVRNIARNAVKYYPKLIFDSKRFDIYFEPNYIPIDINAKKIVTTVHDFSFLLYPEWHPKDRINYFWKTFYKQIYKSDLILTDSNFIKEEAKEFLRIDHDKIRTVYMGYDNTAFKLYDRAEVLNFQKDKGLPENFILFVGSIEPRKNIEKLLQAYIQLPEYVKKEFRLVLAGFSGWENKNIMNLKDKMKKHVMFLGYLSVGELSVMYNSAKLFVYPSLYEGFGLPPVEAMACGCPVVVSNVASLPEVCGDAAYYVDPYNVESIAEGMYKVPTDNTLRKSLIEKGLERAKLFSWEKAAKEHLKVFEEVLNS